VEQPDFSFTISLSLAQEERILISFIAMFKEYLDMFSLPAEELHGKKRIITKSI